MHEENPKLCEMQAPEVKCVGKGRDQERVAPGDVFRRATTSAGRHERLFGSAHQGASINACMHSLLRACIAYPVSVVQRAGGFLKSANGALSRSTRRHESSDHGFRTKGVIRGLEVEGSFITVARCVCINRARQVSKRDFGRIGPLRNASDIGAHWLNAQ